MQIHLFENNVESIRDRLYAALAAEITDQFLGVLNAPLRRERRRHHNAEQIFGADCLSRERSYQSRIDASREAENCFRKAIFPGVVANAEHQCPPYRFDLVAR